MSQPSPQWTRCQILEHLERDFEGQLDRCEIQTCVLAAIVDLSGSICAEALNEMAYKLASYRLHRKLIEGPDLAARDLVSAAGR